MTNSENELRDKAIKLFEANFLDGNKVTEGHVMINVTEVVEYLDEFLLPLVKDHSLQERIDELLIEADRFRLGGHKGLPPGFQTRMNYLQRQLESNKEKT